MKRILISLFSGIALISCGGEEENTGNSLIEKAEKISSDSRAVADSLAKSIEENKDPISYISLWNSSLRISNPKGFKWSPTKVKYGRSMSFLRDSLVGKKKYALVELIDGKQGWINEYVVAKDARTAIVISPTNIYNAPDPLELTKNKLAVGDIVVVYNEQVGDYVEFVTEEKKTKGYLKAKGAFSSKSTDIESGIALGHILDMEPSVDQQKALEEFLENESYKASVFGTKAKEILDSGIEENIVETITDSVSDLVKKTVEKDIQETLNETVEDLGL